MSLMPNTMRDFYEWVKARDPNETYNYYNADDCARARYSRDRGIHYDINDCLDRSPIEQASMQNAAPSSALLTMGDLRREIEEHWL